MSSVQDEMQLFERVRAISSQVAKSQTEVASALGLSRARFQGYLNADREDNLWPLLPTILNCYPDVSREWLYFNEGPMLKTERSENLPACQPQVRAIPVLGLASCGVEGWEQIMQIAVSAALPSISENTVAVIAAGDSMLPAGINSGHICYCDPDQQPIPGDAVMVRRRDGMATIKLFLGDGERGPEWIRLKGWLSHGGNSRREFLIDLLVREIESIAPVVYVRRRI